MRSRSFPQRDVGLKLQPIASAMCGGLLAVSNLLIIFPYYHYYILRKQLRKRRGQKTNRVCAVRQAIAPASAKRLEGRGELLLLGQLKGGRT